MRLQYRIRKRFSNHLIVIWIGYLYNYKWKQKDNLNGEKYYTKHLSRFFKKKTISKCEDIFQLHHASSPFQRVTFANLAYNKMWSSLQIPTSSKPCQEKNRHTYRESQKNVVPSHCCPLRPSERTSKEAARHIGKIKHSLLFRVQPKASETYWK
jgi:hypothetical protein